MRFFLVSVNAFEEVPLRNNDILLCAEFSSILSITNFTVWCGSVKFAFYCLHFN